MITQESRLITQLLSTVYRDPKDERVVRLNIDNAVNILSNNGYNLPSQIFEKKLQEALDKKLVGTAVTPALSYAVVQIVIGLANKYHIDDSEISNYIISHSTEEDVKELQDKIKNWRKEYYGNMDKSEKAALLEALGEKLRPDVLDQIKRS